MPHVNVSSNVERAKVDADALVCTIAKTVSAALEAPESHAMVHLELGLPLCFQLNNEPGAFVHVRSIGNVDAEHTPNVIKELTVVISEGLGVDLGRVYVFLEDVQACNLGINGEVVGK